MQNPKSTLVVESPIWPYADFSNILQMAGKVFQNTVETDKVADVPAEGSMV